MKLIQRFLCLIAGHHWNYNKYYRLVNNLEKICIFCNKKVIESDEEKPIFSDKEYKNDAKK